MTLAAPAAAGPGGAAPPAADQSQKTFMKAQVSALRLVMRVRIWASAAICAFVLIQFPSVVGLYWVGLVSCVALLGWLHYRVERARGGAGWHSYLFALLDAALITFAISFPNPFLEGDWPVQMNFDYHSAPYYFPFLGFAALGFAPRVVLWMGAMCALFWLTTGAVVSTLPDSITYLDFDFPDTGPVGAEKMMVTLHPNFVNISQFIQDAFIILVVSAILATAVWRARRLVTGQIEAERARTNLSRYFSPNMVQELSNMDDPLGAVRNQDAAVLFADMVGFTSMSERQSPEQIIAMLRDFHAIMAQEIFRHDGTVDKYIGDAVMATFGTPRAGPRDAYNAAACAESMIASVETWNRERAARGDEPVAVSVGVHYGPVVLGDIGDAQRLEFAVIGDTVNVASRLEGLTREHGVALLLSQETVDAAKAQAEKEDGLGARFAPVAKATVRGRKGETALWTLQPL